MYLSGLLAGLSSNYEVQCVVCLPQLNLEQLLFFFSAVDLYQVNEMFRVSEEKTTGVVKQEKISIHSRKRTPLTHSLTQSCNNLKENEFVAMQFLQNTHF